ncbi:MAG TPA: hypothetical protein DD670_08675 [Planctomycetaceae bacterium]|nr:hypothetical protein [Planctomycetaceae bacterium]
MRALSTLAIASVLFGFFTLIPWHAARGESENWRTDYAEAISVARAENRMMFVLFQEPEQEALNRYLISDVLGADGPREKLAHYVRVRLPVDSTVRSGGQDVVLLEHEAFAGLDRKPGVAVLDFTNPDADYHGMVVSTLPVRAKEDLSADNLNVLLDLPSATRAERQRMFAARCRALETCHKAGPPLSWLVDYGKAAAKAKRECKMLLVVFDSADGDAQFDCLRDDVLDNAEVRAKLADWVRVRVPIDASIRQDGEEVKLIEQPAFVEMCGQRGMAIVDYAHNDAQYYGKVVSCFPMLGGQPYDVAKMLVILDLPPGTLTQRTLIYAVRIHPERPASTDGELRPELAEEAESHSVYQARIRLQGHHNWDGRFQRIRARLRGGMTATEVCAESWPGEGLLRAAIECVRCWRQSSGHWSAVRSRQSCYGYDMRRGSNGIWYATGIFGHR